MARLKIQAVIDRYKLPRARVARRADIGESTLERLCKHPDNTRVHVETLEKIAAAISQMLLEERGVTIRITVHDLIDTSED